MLTHSLWRIVRGLPLLLALVAVLASVRPEPASAGICGIAGFFGGWAGRTCSVVSHPDKLIKAGKSLATGHPGKALKTVLSNGPSTTVLGLAALGAWVVLGARTALHATAKLIAKTTSPQLRTTWFSGAYWRMAAIAALLTLPFLFAAAVQAVMRSDLTLLSTAAFGYLPLSLLAVAIAAPLTMLLLAATDEMSALVSSAGEAGTRVLAVSGALSVLDRSPFLIFFVALMTVVAAMALWVELLMRDAAVYIVVLMLPLAFAAMVWPARRIWAMRTAEVLTALILSKFVIVAILSLGGAALGNLSGGAGMMVGLVLVALAAFSPWALMRLVPMAELASGTAGHLRGGVRQMRAHAGAIDRGLTGASEWLGPLVARMHQDAAATPVEDAAEHGLTTPSAIALSAGRPARSDPGATENAGADSSADNAGTDPAWPPVDPQPGTGADGTGAHGQSAPREEPVVSGQPAAPAEPEVQPPLPEMFRAPDNSWDFVIGPEGIPSGEHWGSDAPAANGDGPARDDVEPATGGRGAREPGPAEDHDPLPPTQDPQDGRL